MVLYRKITRITDPVSGVHERQESCNLHSLLFPHSQMFVCNDVSTQQFFNVSYFCFNVKYKNILYLQYYLHNNILLDKIDKIKHNNVILHYDMITFIIIYYSIDRKYKVFRIYHFNYNSNFNPIFYVIVILVIPIYFIRNYCRNATLKRDRV